MFKFKIMHFVNSAGEEYVVIDNELDSEPADFARPGYKLNGVVMANTISGNLITLPLGSVCQRNESNL